MCWADRTKRVKDARSEAQKEIEDYRNSKESEFKDFEKEVGLFLGTFERRGDRRSGRPKADDPCAAYERQQEDGG